MARTLVTGGCGFIGQHLVAALLAGGERVTVLDDLSTGRRENLPSHPDLALIEGSVEDRAAVAQAAEGADWVFHLAGVVGVRLATSHRERAYRVSVEGTRNLLAATGSTPVVLFSSSAVYGLSPQVPSREECVVDENLCLAYDGGEPGYSLGKWHMEEMGREAAAGGRPVLIVRPFNVAGPGQVGAFGMVIPTFLARARRGETLTIYGDGQQTRAFSHVTSFIRALLRLAEMNPAWSLPGQVLNLGSDQPVSILELARLVIDLTGSASSIEWVPYEGIYPGFKDATCRIPDTSRARALLGDTPWPTLEELILSIGGNGRLGPVHCRS